MIDDISDDLTVFFVARYGITSVRSRLLALSARRHLPANVKLRMSVPKNYIAPDADTMDLMDSLGIEVTEFIPRLAMVKGEQYLKIDAALQSFETRRALFLESDTIFLDTDNIAELPKDVRVSARVSPMQNPLPPHAVRQLRIFIQSLAPDKNFDSLPVAEGQDPEEVMPFTLYKPSAVLFDTASSFADEWRDLSWRLEIAYIPEKIKDIADRIALSYLIHRDPQDFAPLPKGWNDNSHPSQKAKAHRKLVQYFNMAALLQCKSLLEEARSLHVEADEAGLSCFNELTSWDLKAFLDKL